MFFSKVLETYIVAWQSRDYETAQAACCGRVEQAQIPSLHSCNTTGRVETDGAL